MPNGALAGNVCLYNNFELVAIFRTYISFKWVRRYNRIGEFVLQLEKTQGNIDVLSTGNIIMKENDEEAGFIEDIAITDTVEVRGRFISSILDYRIVSYQSDNKVSLQDTVNQIITDNFIAGDADRIIPELAIEPYSISNQQVIVDIDNNTLTPWLGQQRVGFKVRFDPQSSKYRFKLYEGKNSDAIFMENYRNVSEEQYFSKSSDYKNVVYVRSGTDQILSFGSAQGRSRREGYVTAGNYAADEVGSRFLEDNALKRTLDIKIIDPYSPFEYRKDYDVGDTVKVISMRHALEMSKSILEITEYYDLTGFHLFIVFGDMPRSILTEIRDIKSNLNNIMNSRSNWLDNVMPDITDVLDKLPDLPIGEDLEALIDEKIEGLFEDMPDPVKDALNCFIGILTSPLAGSFI